jgi:hypothetical protein
VFAKSRIFPECRARAIGVLHIIPVFGEFDANFVLLPAVSAGKTFDELFFLIGDGDAPLEIIFNSLMYGSLVCKSPDFIDQYRHDAPRFGLF